MPKVKNKIFRHMAVIAFLMAVLMLVVLVVVQIVDAHYRARDDAAVFFRQIEQVMQENASELKRINNEYEQTMLYNADLIAYMLQRDPELAEDTDELCRIADLLEFDEINIFDASGKIFAGTEPEYFGYTFDSGEQISFFKPMLEDKSLRMVQQIEPNTAAGLHMQYSAVWSGDGKFIVQVGMKPINMPGYTEKHEISFIFTLLRAGTGVDLYAVNTRSNRVVGATDRRNAGRSAEEIGLPDVELSGGEIVADHAIVMGKASYCIMTTVDKYKVAYVVPRSELLRGLWSRTIATAIAALIFGTLIVAAVIWYLDKYILKSLYETNETLAQITQGDLNKMVDVRTSAEMSELSDHINAMIKSVLSTTDIISDVLNKTHIHMGVYQYNVKMKNVRYTDYIPVILELDEREMSRIASDYREFNEYIDNLKTDPIAVGENIYMVSRSSDMYLRMEEVVNNNDVLGVIVDMTDEIIMRRRLESERDIDLLTGLYNRRGVMDKLDELFEKPEELGWSALIMVDADDLKTINDTYGHFGGDRYLMKLAGYLDSFGTRNNISSRLGGDEYIVFLYGYETKAELETDLEDFKRMQDTLYTHLGKGERVYLRFSAGCVPVHGESEYHHLLREADDAMYQNKRERKEQRELPEE